MFSMLFSLNFPRIKSYSKTKEDSTINRKIFFMKFVHIISFKLFYLFKLVLPVSCICWTDITTPILILLFNICRALMFFELAFVEILEHLKSRNYDVNMKKIFTVAYEGSVRKYHNWVTQQLFTVCVYWYIFFIWI